MRTVYIRWGIVLLIAIIVVWVGVSFVLNRKEDVSISSTKSAPLVKVNFDDHSDLLTHEQQIKLQYDLIQATTNKNTTDADIKGTVRSSWIKHPSPGETTFIIDVPKLATSYLISHYVSAEESVDIVNISCVPDKQKIYPKDYCYEE